MSDPGEGCAFMIVLLFFCAAACMFGYWLGVSPEEWNSRNMGRYSSTTGEWEQAVGCEKPVWKEKK